MHGGLCKSVPIKAFRVWGEKYAPSLYEFASPEAKAAVQKKYFPSLIHGAQLGGLYTGSLYFGLHSLMEHGGGFSCGELGGEVTVTQQKTLLLFSYGSGSTASMLRSKINGELYKFERLQPILDRREPITTISMLQTILVRSKQHKAAMNQDILTYKEIADRVEDGIRKQGIGVLGVTGGLSTNVEDVSYCRTLASLNKGKAHGRYLLVRYPRGDEKRRYRWFCEG